MEETINELLTSTSSKYNFSGSLVKPFDTFKFANPHIPSLEKDGLYLFHLNIITTYGGNISLFINEKMILNIQSNNNIVIHDIVFLRKGDVFSLKNISNKNLKINRNNFLLVALLE